MADALIWNDEMRTTIPPRFSVQRSSVRGEGVCYTLWLSPDDKATADRLDAETAFYGSKGYGKCKRIAQRIADGGTDG